MTLNNFSLLGDVRAEADHSMLDSAFYETPDFLSLLESNDKTIVVGRRGTGKSALTYKLMRHWAAQGNRLIVVSIVPDEHEAIALRHYLKKLGDKFLHVRAAVRIVWQYALILEVLQYSSSKYKIKEQLSDYPSLTNALRGWGSKETSFFDKLRTLFARLLANVESPELAIGQIADQLDHKKLVEDFRILLNQSQVECKVLVDRLDEGYESDIHGTAFIDGVMSGSIDLATQLQSRFRPIIFLRDNIFRSVAQLDQDFTRNIEAQTLRLHWDTQTLFYFVCNRLRAAFKDTQENNKKIWNRHTANELQNDDGFKTCLQLTLYRPRDILILLNSALTVARGQGRSAIILEDIERSAKTISTNRLDDLHKEYSQIFPSISCATGVFIGGSPDISVPDAILRLDTLMLNPPTTDAAQQELAIFQDSTELIRALYSVGFLGISDEQKRSYTFCHDGKKSDIELSNRDYILIHPCYWMALNLSKNALKPDEAEEINDEYEIKLSSITPEIREAKIGQIIANLARIPLGHEGSGEFEDWALQALKIAFAGRLDNIEHHPNKIAVNRRDIVARNMSNSEFWGRVRDDYESRQVIFEVKNYEDLTQDDYRQMLSYLSGPYGKLGFFITRANDISLQKGKELDWFRSMSHDHGVVIIKLSGKVLAGILSKQRNPQKLDVGNMQLSALLDTYERNYLGLSSTRRQKKK